MQARHLQSPGVLGNRLFDSGRARSSRGVLAAVAVVVALLSGCAADTAAVSPPGDTVAVSTIEVICVVEGPDGVPHLAHGMLRQFEVSGEAAAPARPTATAEAQVQLLDYGFRLGDTISADALLEVTNVAMTEPHEMIVARLHDGAEAREVGDAIAAGTTPPATFVGGVQAIPPGSSQRLQLDLEPGAYALLCGIPSPDRTPHLAKGMIQEVTIT